MNTVGKKIKEFRKRSGLSQMELEIEVNAAFGSISRIENGLINPTKETLLAIADALQLNFMERSFLLMNDFKNSSINFNPFGKGVQLEIEQGQTGIVENCQKTINENPDEVLFMGNLKVWRTIYPKDYGEQNYIPVRKKKNIFYKAILEENEEGVRFSAEDSNNFRESKLAQLNSDSNVIMVSQDQTFIFECQFPYISCKVKNEAIADDYRELFEKLWQGNYTSAT